MNDVNGYYFLTFAGGMMFGSIIGYLIGLEGWLKEHVLNKKQPKED
jgi:hypothetical protein